jgi:hypothetical protein
MPGVWATAWNSAVCPGVIAPTTWEPLTAPVESVTATNACL